VIREATTDLLAGDRALTVRSRRGHPLLRVGLAPAVAGALAAVLIAPRATAAAALAAMLRGVTLSIDRTEPARSVPEAA